MQLSEEDEKRLKDLANQLEIVHFKIKNFLSPKEGKHEISLNPKQATDLFALINHEERLLQEFKAIPSIDHD